MPKFAYFGRTRPKFPNAGRWEEPHFPILLKMLFFLKICVTLFMPFPGRNDDANIGFLPSVYGRKMSDFFRVVPWAAPGPFSAPKTRNETPFLASVFGDKKRRDIAQHFFRKSDNFLETGGSQNVNIFGEGRNVKMRPPLACRMGGGFVLVFSSSEPLILRDRRLASCCLFCLWRFEPFCFPKNLNFF